MIISCVHWQEARKGEEEEERRERKEERTS